MSRLAENYQRVKTRITKAVGHSQSTNKTEENKRSEVQLIAVSKTRAHQEIHELYQLGQTDFGENYLQEALEKIAALASIPICWHFIGPIQSNKTRVITEQFHWVHSVDREKIAHRLNNQRPKTSEPLNICIQVNLDQENTKSGVHLEGLAQLAKQISSMPRLKFRGLMFIPKPQSDPLQQRETCQKAKAVFDQLKEQFPSMDTLSLGMSSDLEAAIESGSNMVRIGTDIFGPRNPANKHRNFSSK